MNNSFNFRLITHLTPKKEGQGFTLVELLVALIIVGVLAAVALPNLLGQVGRSREVEGKNGIGTLNRAQQAYHMEKKRFVAVSQSPTGTLDFAALRSNNPLGIVLNSRYYNFMTSTWGPNGGVLGTDNCFPPDSPTCPENAVSFASAREDLDPLSYVTSVRTFSGAVGYFGGQYNNIVCVYHTPGSMVMWSVFSDINSRAGVCEKYWLGTQVK